MPPLSMNEIRHRASQFVNEWKNETSERSESQSFWNDFFNVFGISRRRVASFEEPVRNLDDNYGFIDLFWKGTILVEHKSRGRSLDKAYSQALDYFSGLNENELPKYVLVSDFANFRLYNLDDDTIDEFEIRDLPQKIHLFGFIAGYQKREYKEQNPVNIEAAELMGKIHDKLLENGYTGHSLEVYLVRLLFCMFADDTSIFEKDLFLYYIENRTNEDGSDLGARLAELFQVLDTPESERYSNIDETLKVFPYINGDLFGETLRIASFDSDMRETLIECCLLDWGEISPAIFGSLFQSIMDPEERRNLGAHYTSEKNILKLIKPLFLDELWDEFERVKLNRNRLNDFHNKIANFKFLDPACGCGNFLVITYRELRIIELEILKILLTDEEGYIQQSIVKTVSKIDIDCCYGIEKEEFPARIAEVAMWMIDHQMNMKVSQTFGVYFTRLPLVNSANITIENALHINWDSILPKEQLSYIIGNPPFVGKQHQDDEQKADMRLIFAGVTGAGVLDYVTAWYVKAAQFVQNLNIKVAFVSTNSISQGEQVGILWNELFNKYGIKIHFAHRTFKWSNEARGVAGVYVVIIGFANFDVTNKFLYEYNDSSSEPHEVKVRNINPYLVEGEDLVVLKRRRSICDVPSIYFGSMPNDGGNLLLNDTERENLIRDEPEAESFIKPLITANDFINGTNRWCLWLDGVEPSKFNNMPEVVERIRLVKEHRQSSRRQATQRLADFPTLFGENRQPTSDYVLIPLHSSENRKYIPIGYLNKNIIANNSCSVIPESNFYHLGILMSAMHMTWVNYVCGRLEGRYRYSNEIVYNNYPWPENPSQNNIKKVKVNAKKVLKIREEFATNSLSELYDPLLMPPKLVQGHQKLDRSVDLCYRRQPFVNDIKRMEFLFKLMQKYVD